WWCSRCWSSWSPAPTRRASRASSPRRAAASPRASRRWRRFSLPAASAIESEPSPDARSARPCSPSSRSARPCSRRQGTCYLCRAFALAEEARRPEDQERDQQQEPVEVLVRGRDEHRAQRLDQAEQHPADDAAEDRPEAADHDDLEALERRDAAV